MHIYICIYILTTGKHLSEHCKREYPNLVNYVLWVIAEIAVIAADIPEVIGTAFALNILFNAPIWAGVLLAGLNTLLLLGLQRYGIRKLEFAIGILVLVVGGCFFSVIVHARPNPREVIMGMFIPKLKSGNATRDAVALLGALIMPHNLFLHSALVISRKIPRSIDGIKTARKYFMLESGLALLVALVINVAVISVSGSVCSSPNISSESNRYCKNITLESASFLLKDALGKWSSKLYAVSLLASGQSSTVTGTYAGQYIMQGFLELKMKLWLRNLLTRCIAIAPSLVVCIIGGSSGAAKLIIIASMILSFELPFALIPLLRFTSSQAKMGPHRSSKMVSLVAWLLGACSIGINVYFLSTSLVGWITTTKMPKAASIFLGLLIFPLTMLYLATLAYLTLKPEIPVKHSTDSDTETSENNHSETRERTGSSNNPSREGIEMDDIIICT